MTTAPEKTELKDVSKFFFDEEALEKLREENPWQKSPQGVKKLHISTVAAMKMVSHAEAGVEKGVRTGGMPVEVMGLMIGRPDLADHTAMIVTDVFPLPVEGAETKVLADDEDVMNYMIQLTDMLELSRNERCMGWYHSHPFDVGEHSHCFFSSTDVSTQLSWQRMEDRQGNPWCGVVIDPLRSLSEGRPDIMAFRVYPPEYEPPKGSTPDGEPATAEEATERWGPAPSRYYCLDVDYFASPLGSDLLQAMAHTSLWTSKLGSTPALERGARDAFVKRADALASSVAALVPKVQNSTSFAELGIATPDGVRPALRAAVTAGRALAATECEGMATQAAKMALFGRPQSRRARRSGAAEGTGAVEGAGQ